MNDVYAFETDSLTGQRVPLSQYKGKVLLIVNTASKRGLTPRYAGLGTTYKRLCDKGLGMFGFLYNQFGKRGPGNAGEIGTFYEKNYGMSFPVSDKIDVNDPNARPLYKWLASERPSMLGTGAIKWDFTKFLPYHDGTVYKCYAPLTKPEETADDIEWLLVGPDPV